jgi:hypothetical protein
VATANHADRLEVIETRRRFAKVRTASGSVGWTDSNLLLSPQQMDDLTRLSESVAKLPSQGLAKVYEPVNMHTEPNRQAPSFFQIPEGGAVDVIGQRTTPRVARPAVVRRAVAAKKDKGKTLKQAGPIPPMPPSPAPPSNWVELSRPRATDLPGGAKQPQPAPTPLDDWNLVRMRDGKTGWVLARMLSMAIPDEVAQYAEGHRITAYLSLGDVKDKDQIQHNWLWTTISSGQHPYQFDSFRVFVWSVRRHHYETAYIERNVIGYYPVEAVTIPGQPEKAFSLVLQDKQGNVFKRTYAFSGYHVRVVSKTPYQLPAPVPEVHAPREVASRAAPDPPAGWRSKLRGWWRRWRR